MKHKKLKEEKTEQINDMVSEASQQTEEIETEAAPGEIPEAENKEILELKKQSEDYYNRLLRMQADFENYKKRVAREREDMYNSALETIAAQLLPVVDNMERAVDSFRKDQLNEEYICGVEMVCNQVIEILGRNGIKEIEALDKDFDPNLHHAVMREPGEDEEENKVKEVFQKGYILGNKVIRPALVKVSVKQ
ncbi:MAG: nucleotide exchange factor GrpE [Clostridiaceae bacterium]|nr:nucleotide exchange factor GrpE [Clostridiaceae bacterium]